MEPAWKRFKRTVDEVTSGAGATQPFNYDLAPGVTLSTVDPTPAVATWGGSDLATFVLGSDKHIYMKWKAAFNPVSWTPWTDLDCCFNSAPAAVSWGSGRTDVVARGEDNAIYIRTEANSSWTGWQSLGGSAGSAPAITSWGPNRLDIFVKSSTSDALLVKSCSANCLGSSGTWTGWQSPFAGGGLKGRPAAISRGAGLIDIYVRGGDDRLYGNWFHNGVAGNWSFVANGPLACARLSDGTCDPAKVDQYSPAAASRNSNQIDVFVRGAVTDDDKLSVITWESGVWYPFKALGGVLSSGPGTITRVRDTNRADVTAVMQEETSYSAPLKSGVWWKEFSP